MEMKVRSMIWIGVGIFTDFLKVRLFILVVFLVLENCYVTA